MECKHQVKFREHFPVFESEHGPVKIERMDRFYGEMPLHERKAIDVVYGKENCTYKCPE